MPDLLAAVDITPMVIAVMIAWIFSVCVHEFAHALVAFWGGDSSVRSRGYLSFNPFAYIHPVTSILIPCVFLAMGGIPLPGGAVYIDDASLRNRYWRSAVSAAGPLSNILLFVILAIILHPAVGIVDPNRPDQPPWVQLLGAMAVLQVLGTIFNLIPIPPLDGFGIIAPFLSYELRQQAYRIGWMGLIGLYFLFIYVDPAARALFGAVDVVLRVAGLPFDVTWQMYNVALFGVAE